MNLIPRTLRRPKYDPSEPVAYIKRAMIDQGAVDVELGCEPEVVANLYASLALLLSEAPNYSEASLTIKPAGVVEGYTVTVQRANGKTPHQLRREAEAEVSELRNELARERTEWEHINDEVERLRGAIIEHRDSYPPHAGKPEQRLWAALDEGSA